MNVALFTFRTLVSTPFPEIKRVDRNVSSLKKKKKLEIANNISPFKWAGNFKRTGEGRGIESVYERV